MRALDKAAGDRVYRAIKARLIAYEFPPGERIYLDPLAASLGVSTTPVREAMNRLAERGLVAKAARKGFYAMQLSRARLIGHYELTRLLLTLGLEDLAADAWNEFRCNAQVGSVALRLNRRVIHDPHVLARYTGELFSALAAGMANAAVVLAIDLANDHLYFVRTQECRYLDDVQGQLRKLGELALSGMREELAAALHDYHDERIALLPEFLAPFSQE